MRADLTLDAGALLAIERGASGVRSIVDQALAEGRAIHVVPGVLAQVWRGGARQARLARFLDQPEVAQTDFGPDLAKAVGVLIALTGHTDIVDVHVALHARLHGHTVVTSDPDDIRAVDPSLTLIEV